MTLVIDLTWCQRYGQCGAQRAALPRTGGRRLGQPAVGPDCPVPEPDRRYAQLHERGGTTPRYRVRVLAQLTMAVSRGWFLEVPAHPSAVDLPVTEVISELVPQTAPPAADERPSSQ